MSRTAWKGRMTNSPALQRLYAWARGGLSRFASMRGHPYEAARHLLSAWKHVPAARFGERRRERLRRMVRKACYDGDLLLPVARNGFRRDLVDSRLGRSIRSRYGAFPLEHHVRMRFPREDDDPERQGDLMILKAPVPGTGERGVLLIMFHETIQYVAAVYDLTALAPHYTFALETSNWGAPDARFLPYVGSDLEVVVFAPRAPDFAWFEALGTNLRPIRLGSGEWVDPSSFQPQGDTDRQFDVAMVSAWDPLKRHEVLFRAVRAIRQRHGRRLRLALIGYRMGWSQERVEALARRHGVIDACTFFELIPHAEVARIVAASGVSVLLSLQEGSNRSVYESMFCDTPVVVSSGHKGINLDHVNEQTGRLAEDDALDEALLAVLDAPASFQPRAWAQANIGYRNAARRLSECLEARARAEGRPWTADLVAKKNAPSQRYAEPGRYRDFEEAYAALAPRLLPHAESGSAPRRP